MTRTANDALTEIRNEHIKHYGKWHWEAFSEERDTRLQFGEYKGVTEDLLDKLVLARIKARLARGDNQIVIVPQVKTPKDTNRDYDNSELELCCVICRSVPVTSASSIIPFPNPHPIDEHDIPKDYEDVTFIFFICKDHENMSFERLIDMIEDKRLHAYFIYIGREHNWQERNT